MNRCMFKCMSLDITHYHLTLNRKRGLRWLSWRELKVGQNGIGIACTPGLISFGPDILQYVLEIFSLSPLRVKEVLPSEGIS